MGCFVTVAAFSQQGRPAPNPLYRDPVYDGAADPVVVYNKQEKKWWMLYTNRRANMQNAQGVDWCHGTRIGIAESADAAVFRLPDGTWRLWYNNEPDGKSIWYADSKDLYNWTDKGKAIAARGEGPKVFPWKGTNWMIVDVWKGMELYQSDDLLNWKKQTSRILEEPGKGAEDQAIGGHPDVLVQGDKAYLFYFTHPGRKKENPAPAGSYDDRRTLIQMAELKYKDGIITCDRDQPVYINLKPNKKNRENK